MSLDFFRRSRSDCVALFRQCEALGWRKVALYGAGDLAEIAILSASETAVEVVCVIDSRLGIPISLSVLYMFVGRRASIALEGVNLPGHFVGRHGTVLFDCFYRGEILTTRDCARILARQGHTLDATHLQPAHPRLIMMRILANLLHIFEREDNKDQQQLVASWIRLMNRRAD